ncbi:molybdenum-dependent transcriptional regulator [Erwinia sp. 9145]|uniref:molybdenum-dependent transcriptional regulator n=1 Tax=Erwinia sp. 9145 TaxID=1500895 RepID=UPI000558212A|nr:molybdenum-dependent transcriptional regulator [Erwinia sp. 9145]
MQAELSLILKSQQRLFADPRRIALLKQIQLTGSISQGAKQAGVSYKSAWDAINEMNTLADRTLVERATGGKGGGGALLTPYGERLLQLYALMEQIQQRAFDVLQDDVPPGSLLGAIARFSLQTSARNQLFGSVVERDARAVQQHVEILLADGATRITAALTERSANRLALDSGKEVLVLIKAPWIDITCASSDADNQLSGIVSHLETGEEQSEVLVTLPGGETLCATLANQRVTEQKLRPGLEVIAHFDADRVIIATLL